LFAYPFIALTQQQLKTENNKLNIYTQYLMKSILKLYDFFFTGPSDFIIEPSDPITPMNIGNFSPGTDSMDSDAKIENHERQLEQTLLQLK
jgi:hypothetical protein